MRLYGLGSSTWPTSVPDSASCGVNPCGALDNMGSVIGQSSQACADFMECALPNDPTTIALNKSLVAGVSTAVGQDVGNVAVDAGTGVLAGLGNSLGVPSWAVLVGAIALGLIVLKEMK